MKDHASIENFRLFSILHNILKISGRFLCNQMCQYFNKILMWL